MGTHPIFESDFDCLTDIRLIVRTIRTVKMSAQADQIIAYLRSQIDEIKAQAPLPKQVQETILKQENAQLRKIVEKLKSDLTALELRNGKIQVALPKPQKQQAQKSKKESTNQKQESKPEAKKEEKTEEKPKKEKKQKESKPKAAPAPPADDKPIDVSRLSMKVGKIVECVKHPDADALYLEKIECGEAEPRQVISGLVKHVPIEEMRNRKVCMIANLNPAKMRGITSYGMVLCAKTGPKGSEKVELIRVPDCAEPGDIITTDDFLGDNWAEPDNQMNPKKKIFETVQPDFQTTEALVATWKGKPLLIKGKEEQTRGKFVSD